MKEKMTINDLKSGQIVRLRNGNYCKYEHIGKLTDLSVLIDENDRSFCFMEKYRPDLTHIKKPEWDIVAVYPVPNWKKGFNPDTAESLWDADEVLEISIEELEKKFGCKIKIIE